MSKPSERVGDEMTIVRVYDIMISKLYLDSKYAWMPHYVIYACMLQHDTIFFKKKE